MRVLIGYSSAHGSTAEIARRIAAVLRDTPKAEVRDPLTAEVRETLTVEVRPLEDVHRLEGFDAVVLGSAIHSQSWLPEAAEFVERHSAELRARPVWLFSVGMSGALPRFLRAPAKAAQNRKLAEALREQARPRGHGLFSGVAAAEEFPRWVRIVLRAIGGRLGDLRDWEEIDDWARGVRTEVTGRGEQKVGQTG
ncbi:flavodoxin domain-containing protein [Brevibacterium daeguense]|uniref:Flavodoxin domain-containing protein n=1 Tax=Brevibacterium daeguense TaxID=909936 RepID=A0ABP8EG77_9MICO|nr:flavodoxin domain-containing protein [Brevibacterium daeguense]